MLGLAYRRRLNIFALDQLLRTVDIPDPALGIGWAEVLQSVPLKIHYGVPAQVVMREPVYVIDDLGVKGQGAQVSNGAFPATGYMGAAVYGWGEYF